MKVATIVDLPTRSPFPLSRLVTRTSITELSDGQSIDQAFRVADKQLRVNRQGGKYILLKLADRSATIAAMMWNADERIYATFDRGDYAICRGRTQVHNGVLQIIVTSIDRMDPSEVDSSDFERFDAATSTLLIERLEELLSGLRNNHLRLLGEAFMADEGFVAKFLIAAAAVNNHHAYPGGLLRHTVDLMELCQLISPRYDYLDGELLMFGAFLHDLGKIEELTSGEEVSYSDRGQLIGHIVIGVQLLGEKISCVESELGEKFPLDLRYQLEHLIVSHHGQIEFGSPKLPVTLEALTLHHLDNLDAKLSSFRSIMEADVAADPNWTNYSPSIGRKLWKKPS